MACSALRSFLTVKGRTQKVRLMALLTTLRSDDGPCVLARWTGTYKGGGDSECGSGLSLVRTAVQAATVHKNVQ